MDKRIATQEEIQELQSLYRYRRVWRLFIALGIVLVVLIRIAWFYAIDDRAMGTRATTSIGSPSIPQTMDYSLRAHNQDEDVTRIRGRAFSRSDVADWIATRPDMEVAELIQAFAHDGHDAHEGPSTDVDQANDRGDTLLMLASRRGYRLTAQALIARGANPQRRGKEGLTASEIASRRGFEQLATILEKAAVPDVGPSNHDLDRGCEAGDGDACDELGARYYEGRAVEQDDEAAGRFFRLGCTYGAGRACANAGTMEDHGRGMPRNRAQALKDYARGCELGHGRACVYLAWAYQDGDGFQKSTERAIHYYRLGVELSSPLAYSGLGRIYETGLGVQRDLVRASQLYKEGCEHDSAKACARLGAMTLAGKGVEANAGGTESLALYEKACDLEDGPSCLEVAEMYILIDKATQGIVGDSQKVRRLLERACRLGVAEACTMTSSL